MFGFVDAISVGQDVELRRLIRKSAQKEAGLLQHIASAEMEKLLQTPLDDYRKFVVWRILAPYPINIRKCSSDEASNVIRNWLDRCRNLRQLDFSPNYMIKHNCNSAKRCGYLPISLEKLKIENTYLYNVLAR